MPIDKLKISQNPILNGDDLTTADRIIVLDVSATTGPGSGPAGTLKTMFSSRVASFGTTRGVVHNLRLQGIDTDQEVFTWVAQAINAYGPYEGNPGEGLYFRAYQISGSQLNYSVTITYFKLISGRLIAGGPSNTIDASELILGGGPWVVNAQTNDDLFLEIGDAGAGPVHTYFNLGENQNPNGDPWIISGERFFTGLLNGEPTVWQFLRGDGNYGGDSGNNTVAADFINLSLQPPADGFPLTIIHNLSLTGVNIAQPELSYIAQAVRMHGPFTSLPGQQMVFKVQANDGNGGIIERYYRLLKNYSTIGGVGGQMVLPSWFMPDGESLLPSIEAAGIIIELGDIAAQNVWDVFNDGDNGDPWDMSEYRFVRATQNGELKLWAFQGLEHFYGGTVTTLATEDDFFLINDQPELPVESEIPTEELIMGTATENLSITGSNNISLSIAAHQNLKLTGNATINFTNAPSLGQSFTRTYKVYGDTGVETLGVSNSTAEYGEYQISEENLLTVLCVNTATEGVEIHVFFSQPQ